MSTTQTGVHRIPIVSLDDPSYAHLARRVTFPASDRSKTLDFFPAFEGFNTGDGAIDVSLFYSFDTEPQAMFDRHLRTEEFFIPVEGDFYIPLAPCRDAADPDEQPAPDDFVCALVREGEGMILNANVWHNGGWPADPQKGTRFLMILSGHRAGSGVDGRVDHIVKEFPAGTTILPDWNR